MIANTNMLQGLACELYTVYLLGIVCRLESRGLSTHPPSSARVVLIRLDHGSQTARCDEYVTCPVTRDLLSAWFGGTPFEHPLSHNTP